MLGYVNKAQLIIILFAITIFTIAFFYIREESEHTRKYVSCRKGQPTDFLIGYFIINSQILGQLGGSTG